MLFILSAPANHITNVHLSRNKIKYTISNRTKLKAPAQNQQTRVLACQVSYCRWLSSLLCLCDVFPAKTKTAVDFSAKHSMYYNTTNGHRIHYIFMHSNTVLVGSIRFSHWPAGKCYIPTCVCVCVCVHVVCGCACMCLLALCEHMHMILCACNHVCVYMCVPTYVCILYW